MRPLGYWISVLAMTLAALGTSTAAEARGKGESVAAKPTARAAPAPSRASVEVLWGGRWWPAEVIERRSGLTKIHYTGWGSEWDEWIEPTRLRKAAPRVALRAGKPGQRVEIEWHGSWWDGEITETRSGLYKVHYTGWGAEWDEWVEPIRLRARSK